MILFICSLAEFCYLRISRTSAWYGAWLFFATSALRVHLADNLERLDALDFSLAGTKKLFGSCRVSICRCEQGHL